MNLSNSDIVTFPQGIEAGVDISRYADGTKKGPQQSLQRSLLFQAVLFGKDCVAGFFQNSDGFTEHILFDGEGRGDLDALSAVAHGGKHQQSAIETLEVDLE